MQELRAGVVWCPHGVEYWHGAMPTSDMLRLRSALAQGLYAGLTIGEAKEILVHLYAYAGFPRSLNALTELMKLVDARKQQGTEDAPGREPSRPVATGAELLAVGTANRTHISGAPVKGALCRRAGRGSAGRTVKLKPAAAPWASAT